jgi:hypothetical protein
MNASMAEPIERSVGELLRLRAARLGDRPFLRFEGREELPMKELQGSFGQALTSTGPVP